MLLEDLRQISDAYEHIYISPHLDDAALSCGGAIARYASDGARVLVVTLGTATPSPDAVLSGFAHATHLMWGLEAERAMAERQREDVLALERLGADIYHAGLLDAIYRVPEAYVDNSRLFGTPIPDDPLLSQTRRLLQELQRHASRATFYAPLGVGNHVDHQIVYVAAQQVAGAAVAFYEDFPYMLWPNAFEQRMQALGERFVASTIDIDATLARKIGAIAAYATQLSSLFDRPDEMAQIVSDYAESLRPDTGTYGERVWLRDVQ